MSTAVEPVRERDAYDVANEYFDEHEVEVQCAWSNPGSHRYGFLFGFCNRLRFRRHRFAYGALYNIGKCGCPLEIRIGRKRAATDFLTKYIRDDDSIPIWTNELNAENRRRVADVQRMVDRELGRTPPQIPE